MNDFTFHVPTKVYFGDQLHKLGETLAAFGKRVLLCYGGGSIKASGLYDRVRAQIEQAGLTCFELSGIAPNPRITSVREGARLCKDEHVDVVLAVGGGSTIDCAKFVAAGACYDGDPWDIVKKRAVFDQCLPIVTVLTLSATGSEMDNCGVITNLETNEKLGAGYSVMRPAVSFLDPANTFSVPPYQTACGAADILSHILEEYFCREDKPEMLVQCMEAFMRTVIRFAPVAMRTPTDYEARANLMWVSSWAINDFIACGGGTAWSCHGIEHELSAYYDITHGLGLAIVTPRWMEFCLRAKTAPKFARFAKNVMGVVPKKAEDDAAVAKRGIAAFADFLFGTLGLQSTLTAVGIDKTHLADMAKAAIAHGAFDQTYIPLSQKDIEKIYEACL